MASKNFVVHNGLTVGPLTIDATTGDITTSGNLTLSGGGSIAVSNVAVSSIALGDSSINIADSGSGSTVYITVDGTTEHTVDADGVNLASGDRYAIAGTSVLNATTLGTGVVNSSLETVGNLITLAVTGNIIAGNVNVTNSLSATNLIGTLLTASQTNVTALGNLTTLAASGTVRTIGQLYANSGVATSSTETGAVVVAGGIGLTGGIYTGADIYIAGKTAATVDDATALSIALGG